MIRQRHGGEEKNIGLVESADQKRGKLGRKASDTTEKTLQQKSDELKNYQNAYLEQENSFLRELDRLERPVMANKK